MWSEQYAPKSIAESVLDGLPGNIQTLLNAHPNRCPDLRQIVNELKTRYSFSHASWLTTGERSRMGPQIIYREGSYGQLYCCRALGLINRISEGCNNGNSKGYNNRKHHRISFNAKFFTQASRVYLRTDRLAHRRLAVQMRSMRGCDSSHFDIWCPYSSLIPTNTDIAGTKTPAMFHFHFNCPMTIVLFSRSMTALNFMCGSLCPIHKDKITWLFLSISHQTAPYGTDAMSPP